MWFNETFLNLPVVKKKIPHWKTRIRYYVASHNKLPKNIKKNTSGVFSYETTLQKWYGKYGTVQYSTIVHH